MLEAAIDWTDLRVIGAEDGAGRPVDLVETIGEGSFFFSFLTIVAVLSYAIWSFGEKM